MALPTSPRRWFQEWDTPFDLFDRPMDDFPWYEEDDEFVLTIDMPGF